jgi:hypothetical protein
MLVIEVFRAITSVHFQLWLGSFRMTSFVLLPLQGSMVQRGACKHDQWRGYMTVLVVNHGILKSISILSAVLRLMITFDVGKLWDCLHKKVQCTLAIHY